jgi:glycosyltransferase involved in cell wall biosynthesis
MDGSKPYPLLIISDAITASSGLGRIARDLATRIHAHMPEFFRVATLGYGGITSRHFGFPQYPIEGLENWVIPTLPEIWRDFAGNDKGYILTIWDASRLDWFSQPLGLGRDKLANFPALQSWLIDPPFKRWGYFPIDAHGPNQKLAFPLRQTIVGFDRILAYGQWAQDLIAHSLADNLMALNLSHLPHGIDTSVFYQHNRSECRKSFFTSTASKTLTGVAEPIQDDELLIGIVATNQSRKNWDLGIQTVSLIAKSRKVRLWIHTDVLERCWSIPGLLIDYGILDKTVLSLGLLQDEQMAKAYSACDLTLGIGLGEGWGFPLAESLACGTPVLHGDYAGGKEIVPPSMLMYPRGWYAEGLYACVRPAFDAQGWVDRAEVIAGMRTFLNPQFAWNNLWPRWQSWLEGGCNGNQH